MKLPGQVFTLCPLTPLPLLPFYPFPFALAYIASRFSFGV
jgi:hypothetical protein